MTLGELKALINRFPVEMDNMTLYDGDPAVGAPMAVVKIECKDNIDGQYLHASTVIIADSGKYTKQFTDIRAVADQIRSNKKIAAIKEVRNQLKDEIGRPMALKDAKDFVDRYMPMGYQDIPGFSVEEAAAKFVADHTVEFFEDNDFNL
jgi:ribosomal protein L7/L12